MAESIKTDIIAIHDYENKPQRLAHRYGSESSYRISLIVGVQEGAS